MSNEVIAVLGAGSWGTALANVAAENGHDVRLWTYKPEQVVEINEQHRNSKYLGDNPLDEGVVATADMTEAVRDATIVLSVVPTKATREVSKHLSEVLAELDQQIVLIAATKGLAHQRCLLKRYQRRNVWDLELFLVHHTLKGLSSMTQLWYQLLAKIWQLPNVCKQLLLIMSSVYTRTLI